MHKRPLSVLHVIETLGLGGAENCLKAGLPALRELGVRVAVMPLAAPLDLAPDLERAGVPVLFARNARTWLRATRPHSFDVVHTHLFRANVFGRALARAFGAPVVSSLHSADYGTEGPGKFGLRLRLDQLTARWSAARLVSVSRVVQADYENYLGPSLVIPNPVDLAWLRDLPSREEARRALGLDERPLVLSIARLHVQKGLDVLATVAARRPDVVFAVAGRGPEQGSLQARLRLLGGLPHSQLRLWLAAADAGVLPSRWESFGVAAVEMLGAGLPLVVTDIDGLADTVGDAALKIPVDDADALAAALERALTDAAWRAQMRREGPAQAARYAPRQWAERLLEHVYTPLVT